MVQAAIKYNRIHLIENPATDYKFLITKAKLNFYKESIKNLTIICLVLGLVVILLLAYLEMLSEDNTKLIQQLEAKQANTANLQQLTKDVTTIKTRG